MHEIRPRLIGACSIVVGDTELNPGASHLFALLLAFSLTPRDPWTRRGLQELLFGQADSRLAAHRLRQLLYRLRGFGVVLQESSTGVVRLANPVADPLDVLDATDLVAPHPASVGLDPLALYAPRMPAPFLDWLDQRRDVLRSALASRRMSELRLARERQDWPACARLASALYVIDPVDEEIVLAVAESNAMLGRRDTALDAIDQLLRDTGDTLDARPALKRMRTRIASTRIARREGTLRGREECLAFLAEQWERAMGGGGGRVCAIFGAPGMGKSRVGETFAAAVRLSGGQVVQHRCDANARQSPLALFSQLVPDLRRRRGSIGADPALSGALDQIAPGSTPPVRAVGSAEERRDEVRRAIVDLLDAVSSEQPMLVVVDDAHLLDDASRGVIRGLADSANSAQVLIVLLCRPRPDGQTLLSASARFGTYTLTPLSERDSRALLVELAEARPLTEAQVDWALTQADGNAFYLHALAQHPSDHVAMPAHIRSLAQTSYLGVSADARTVLDGCLLLDTLASPARVTRVAGVDDRTLLAAVRELEDADLLRYEEGIFAGPHAIIRDVLDDLMPSVARALLNHRIAEMLSAECDDPARARLVGWAAVRSWLACGDREAAVALGQRVAAAAAAVGEPEAGAQLLSRIPRSLLQPHKQRELLDDIIELADIGKCPTLMRDSLGERISLALLNSEPTHSVTALTLRAIALDISNHNYHQVRTLFQLVADCAQPVELHTEACAWAQAAADSHFDRGLADSAFAQMGSSRQERSLEDVSYQRGLLIYHTTFGDRFYARDLATSLLKRFARPSILDNEYRLRSLALFSLFRLGFHAEVAARARAESEYMSQAAHLKGADYFASMSMAAFLACGDTDSAERIMTDLIASQRRRRDSETVHTPGYYSAATYLAISSGDHATAKQLLLNASHINGGVLPPRVNCARLGFVLRLRQLRGEVRLDDPQVKEFINLFDAGKAFGGMDYCAAVLYQCYADADQTSAGSAMLSGYLDSRREIGDPEELLQQLTRGDPAWASQKASA